MKITQRKHQESKHKLKFTPNAKPAITYLGSVPSSSLGSPNEMAENNDDEEFEVDLDVVEMTFANTDSAYSYVTPSLSAGKGSC